MLRMESNKTRKLKLKDCLLMDRSIRLYSENEIDKKYGIFLKNCLENSFDCDKEKFET